MLKPLEVLSIKFIRILVAVQEETKQKKSYMKTKFLKLKMTTY